MKIAWHSKRWLLILSGLAVIVLGDATVVYRSLPWYWAVAIFVPAFLLFGTVASKDREEKIEAHFSGRPVLGEEEFGKHYFPASRSLIAARIRKILANHVGVDLSRMNPSDRFIEDLLMDDFDSMSTVDFAVELEKEFQIKIPDSAAEKLTTFQSVVDYVADAVAAKAP